MNDSQTNGSQETFTFQQPSWETVTIPPFNPRSRAPKGRIIAVFPEELKKVIQRLGSMEGRSDSAMVELLVRHGLGSWPVREINLVAGREPDPETHEKLVEGGRRGAQKRWENHRQRQAALA